MRRKLGDDYYIVNFQDSDEADRAFEADPARFIERLMRCGQMTRAEYEKLPAASRPFSMLRLLSGTRRNGEPLLNDEELAYYARASDVVTSVIGGKVVMEERNILGLNEQACMAAVNAKLPRWAALMQSLGGTAHAGLCACGC